MKTFQEKILVFISFILLILLLKLCADWYIVNNEKGIQLKKADSNGNIDFCELEKQLACYQGCKNYMIQLHNINNKEYEDSYLYCTFGCDELYDNNKYD